MSMSLHSTQEARRQSADSGEESEYDTLIELPLRQGGLQAFRVKKRSHA